MAIDSLTIYILTEQLQKELIGSRVNNVYQPEYTTLLLEIQTPDKELLGFHISTHPQYYHFHWQEIDNKKHIQTATSHQLQKILTGTKIKSIEQKNFDRIVHIKFKRYDEEYTLIIELMGRFSNIILTDKTDTILFAWRYVSIERSNYREITIGSQYKTPPPYPTKWNLFNLKEEQLHSLIDESSKEKTLKRLQKQTIYGISPLLHKELLYRIKEKKEEESKDLINHLWQEIENIRLSIQKKCFNFYLYRDEKQEVIAYSLLKLELYNDYNLEIFSDLNYLLTIYYQELEKQELQAKFYRKLRKSLENELKYLKKSITNLKKQLEVSERSEEFRHYGELIMSNLANITRGDKIAIVIDYYDVNQRKVEVKLDPLLTPVENAQYYFKRAKKSKRGRNKIIEQLKKFEQKYRELFNIQNELNIASSDLFALEKLQSKIENKLISKENRKRKTYKRNKIEIKPREYIISDGWQVLVGRDRKENDLLTHRYAKNNDIWFHALAVPGSHIILRRAGKKDMPSKRALEEAASIAAYYSRARHSEIVPVIYTEKRYVRKPRGSASGVAVCTHEKTLFVHPKLPDD